MQVEQIGVDIVITVVKNKYVKIAEFLIAQMLTIPQQSPGVDSQQYQIREIRRRCDRTIVQYDENVKNEHL